MHIAEIGIGGVVYRFGSNTYKWVYKQAVSFAKHYLYHHDSQRVIIISIGDTLIFVTPAFIGIDASWNDYYRILER